MAIGWNDKTTARREREALANEFEGACGIGGKYTDVVGRRSIEEVEHGTACCGDVLIGAGGTEWIIIRLNALMSRPAAHKGLSECVFPKRPDSRREA
jgi:hypothetical protein